MEEKHIGDVNGMEVWVFEEKFGSIPHCHLISSESGLEAEISIMDWSVIGGTLSNDEHDAFMKWLDEDADDNPVYSRKVDVIYYYQLCNQACNEMLAYCWSSIFYGVFGGNRTCWGVQWNNGYVSKGILNYGYCLRAFAVLEDSN